MPYAYYDAQPDIGGDVIDPQVDLVADLNAEDDDRLGWSTPGDARGRVRIRPEVMIIASNCHA